jgi:hypothetical protein
MYAAVRTPLLQRLATLHLMLPAQACTGVGSAGKGRSLLNTLITQTCASCSSLARPRQYCVIWGCRHARRSCSITRRASACRAEAGVVNTEGGSGTFRLDSGVPLLHDQRLWRRVRTTFQHKIQHEEEEEQFFGYK